MKKLKQFFSLMLVGVLVLTGSVLMACGKKETGTPPQDTQPTEQEIAIGLLNQLVIGEPGDYRGLYSKWMIDGEGIFSIDFPDEDTLPIIEDEMFDKYLSEEEKNSMHDYTYIDAEGAYVGDGTSWLPQDVKIAQALLALDDFEWETFYNVSFTKYAEYDYENDEHYNFYMSLEFSEDKIRLVKLENWSSEDSNGNPYETKTVLISDVYYSNDNGDYNVVYHERLSGSGDFTEVSYSRLTMPTYEGLIFNNHVEFNYSQEYSDFDGDSVAELFELMHIEIYSEINRKSFTNYNADASASDLPECPSPTEQQREILEDLRNKLNDYATPDVTGAIELSDEGELSMLDILFPPQVVSE